MGTNMSKIAKVLWTMVVMAVCMLVAALAVGAPASQPASGPVVAATTVPLDNLAALAQVIIGAINAHNWPVIVVCLLVVALFIERHFKGLTGNRFSVWLGTKWGLLLSSLFTAVVTAAAGVAAQGWKAIGNACVAAGVVGVLNFVAQFAGPATKAAGAVAPPADAAAGK
jgi:hypothetical protein